MRTTRSLAAVIVVLVALGAAAGLARGSAEVVPSAAPPMAQPEPATGADLYLQSCASCHGADGGGTAEGPPLIGVGAASVDFQLTTGRMPFAEPPGAQARRKPVAFNPEQIASLVDHVVALGGTAPAGPDIPEVDVDESLLSRGQALFIGNCAPCHGATANGGAVGGGSLAPPLDVTTPVQTVEAMLAGPGQMPVFRLGETDLDAVATYVDYLQDAEHPGGLSIGGIGPVPEGFVAWVLGMGALVIVVYLVGRTWDPSGTGAE